MKTATLTQSNDNRKEQWQEVSWQDLLLTAFALIILALYQSDAHAAEETYTELSEVTAGALLIKTEQGYQGMTRLNQAVNVNINGMVAEATIDQQFHNPSNDWIEAIYVFPLPTDSAVHDMRITVGDQVIQGVIKEKQEAKQIYLVAKKEGRRAGLLNQERPNLFTTRVANIGPGEKVTVHLKYLETLTFDQGTFSTRIPMTITPRYIPGERLLSNQDSEHHSTLSVSGWGFATNEVPDAQAITPLQTRNPQSTQPNQTHTTSINISLTPGFELSSIDSPYHNIVSTKTDNTYTITLDNGVAAMDRDFMITWKPVATEQPTAAIFRETKQNTTPSEHGLIMVVPPTTKAVTIPPRELIIVIDTSGSMGGHSIQQAKEAVHLALSRLRPEDYFNVIQFNSSHHTLFHQSQPANSSNRQQAKRYVQQLTANGGTEMRGALQAALQSQHAEAHIKQIVFITDGSVGNESSLFQLIHQQLGRSRLFTVGIGSAPNQYFMKRAAKFGKGSFITIGSSHEVQAQMGELFSKLERPVLTNVSLVIPNVEAELYPNVIPDLYYGEPLVIHGRFSQWPDSITVKGDIGKQSWSQTLTVPQSTQHRSTQHQSRNSAKGIATLWAREKVASLENSGIAKGNRNAYRQEILDTGLSYGITTRFTSFVAVAEEIVRPQHQPIKKSGVPNLMPAGSRQVAPSIGMPSTGLGLNIMLMIGTLLLGLATLMHRFMIKREKRITR